MTGSLDKSLRLWNLNSEEMVIEEGPCVRAVTDHSGAILCLTQLGHDLVCSGGHDLCLWDTNGALLDKFDRCTLPDTSDVQTVLRLETAHLSVVAASNYKCLSVFDIEKPMLTDKGCYKFMRDQKRRYLNQSHVYPITFLSGISASFFASGCQGGSIIVWSVQHLSALKIFYCLPQPQRELTTTEFTKVSCIEVVAEGYVFAAVGCGFKMYDVLGQEKDAAGHPKPLVSHTCAHLLPLTSLTFLQDRAQLVTVAEDKTMRLWGSPAARQRREGEGNGHATQGKSAIEMFIGPTSRKSSLPTVPLLLGELHLHAGVIKVLSALEEQGVVTGGDDGSLVLWKDGERERERRDREMYSFILGQPHAPE
jgi:WD40 repeat protein